MAKIKATVKQQHKAGDSSLQLLDLEPQFDWWSMSPEKRKKVSELAGLSWQAGKRALDAAPCKQLIEALACNSCVWMHAQA